MTAILIIPFTIRDPYQCRHNFRPIYSDAMVSLRASCAVPSARSVMFLLLFDFLLLLLVFHALLTPDLGVGVPIPEHQTKYGKTAAKLGLKNGI
jgi:hypothetical protein